MKRRAVLFMGAHVVAPIVLGSLIYVLWRSPTLRVFRWLGGVGLGPAVEWARDVAEPLGAVLPSWLLYSLPDGLWVYAVTAFMAWTWMPARPKDPDTADAEPRPVGWAAVPWLGAGLGIGCGTELLQAIGAFPGTFDAIDLLLSAVAGAVAFWQARLARRFS
jgi:hypothetical protein